MGGQKEENSRNI